MAFKLKEIKKIIAEYDIIQGRVLIICEACFKCYKPKVMGITVVGKNCVVTLYDRSPIEFPKEWLEIENLDDLFEEFYKRREVDINNYADKLIDRYEKEIQDANTDREKELKTAREDLDAYRKKWLTI